MRTVWVINNNEVQPRKFDIGLSREEISEVLRYVEWYDEREDAVKALNAK